MRKIVILTVLFVGIIAAIFCTVLFVAFPLKYKNYIREAAVQHGVDKALIASVINAESRFRPAICSAKGAVGLMQIMPETAKYIAQKMGNAEVYDLYDPRTNINMGTFYLKYLLDKFCDVKTSLMAYNAGEGNVTAWLGGADRLKTTPFRETNAYVEKVMNGMNFYKFRI